MFYNSDHFWEMFLPLDRQGRSLLSPPSPQKHPVKQTMSLPLGWTHGPRDSRGLEKPTSVILIRCWAISLDKIRETSGSLFEAYVNICQFTLAGGRQLNIKCSHNCAHFLEKGGNKTAKSTRPVTVFIISQCKCCFGMTKLDMPLDPKVFFGYNITNRDCSEARIIIIEIMLISMQKQLWKNPRCGSLTGGP